MGFDAGLGKDPHDLTCYGAVKELSNNGFGVWGFSFRQLMDP